MRGKAMLSERLIQYLSISAIALMSAGCMSAGEIPGATSSLTCPLPENKGCKPIVDVYRSPTSSASAASTLAPRATSDPALPTPPPAFSTQPNTRAQPRAIVDDAVAPPPGLSPAQASMVAYRDTPNTGLPVRSAPRMMRIWVAPYEDSDGALRDQGYYYVMIDAGRWNLEHNQKRIMNAFAPTKGPKAATPAPSLSSNAPGASGSSAPGALAASQMRQALRDVLPTSAPAQSQETKPDAGTDEEGSQ